jgi:hypothetical protein
MTLIPFIVLYCVAYLPEDGQKRLKHVGRLPHVCKSNYSAVVGIYTVTWINVNNSYTYINFVLPVHRKYTTY